jgi:hypothetical protein
VFAKYFVGLLKDLTFLPHCVARVYRFAGLSKLGGGTPKASFYSI